jgi:hypothetical protein
MSEREWVAVGSRERTLSLAVKPVDAVTGDRPVESPRITIDEVDADPVETRSGYHLFLDLPATPDTVTVVVDGGSRYLDAERVVDRSGLDRLDPSVVVALEPTPAYPFAPRATLLRGRVTNRDDEGVEGVALSLRHADVSTVSTAGGDYVLWLGDVVRESVETVGDRRLVRLNNQPPRLVAEHDDYRRTAVTQEIEEATTTVRHVELRPPGGP